MGLENIFLKLLEGAPPLDYILVIMLGYFLIKELNAFNQMKNKVHKYESDIIILKRDINELKKQLEKLGDEHRSYTTRKGGKHS
ncbi:Uncharacterised protein [uncultured archaeon]|nr:Uncharacterised protein [uncultured archaeon]